MTATIIFPRDVERKRQAYCYAGFCLSCGGSGTWMVRTSVGMICHPCVDVLVTRQVAELQAATPWDADDYQIRLAL